MKELLTLLVGCALANNIVLTKSFGLTNSVNAVNNKKVLNTALYVGIVLVVSSLICWPVNQFVIAKFNLAYLENLVYVAVIVVVSAVVAVTLKSCKKMFVLTVFNSAILATCLLNVTNGYTFVQTIFATVGTVLALLVAMYLYNGAIYRVKQQEVVKSFRGLPIQLLTVAIVALAVLAFK